MSIDIELEEQFARTSLKRSTLKRVLKFMLPYKAPIILSLVMELLYVGAEILPPHLIKMGIDKYLPDGNFNMIFILALIYLLSILTLWSIAYIQIKLVVKAGFSFLTDLRKALFHKLQELSLSYFDKTKEGRIISRIDRDVENLEEPLIWGPFSIVNSFFSILLVSYIMVNYSLKLSLATLAVLPPLLVATEIFRRKGLEAFRKVKEGLSIITAEYAESINGVRVIQAYAMEKQRIARFQGVNDLYIKQVLDVSRLQNTYLPITTALYGAAIAIILFYGAYLVSIKEIGIGVLTAFILYLGQFFGPIRWLSSLYSELLSASAALERIFLLLDTSPDIKDREGVTELPRIKGDVSFENVYFNYDREQEEPWTLADFNLLVRSGEQIAIVGPTGAGKTTIINLLSHFYEPQKGSIKIDGFNLQDISLSSLRKQLGIVLQDNFLFSGTVMDNLKYSRPDVADEEVIKAAKALGSHDIISGLSDGYNTKVSGRGEGLSLGEKQLICFTRIFLANPRILILDEATSAVDTITERIVQEAFNKLIAGRTSFIIAHRLSTIRNADRIIVIEKDDAGNGYLLEEGTHEELIRTDSKYASLYKDYIRAN
ncbi:MAG: ABC transporter ATP-binding protein [Candidatus Coatesbacteria bacterium]|nr:ABC transporter ATP-binding protein [Candidatus Coatesbacteria bacterium]